MSTTVLYLNDYSSIFEDISVAEHRVLLLDYDGTLAPFSADRNRAFPYAPVPQLLNRIMTGCRTRLIIITDRTVREIIPLLGLHPTPEIWGAYGLQRLHADGRHEEAEVEKEVLHAVAQAQVDLERTGLAQFIELKTASIAVHWRGLSASEILDVRERAYKILEPLTFHAGLLLAEFDGGVAIRPRWANKGNAVQTVLSEIDPDVPVAYLGDDTTDEDAFRVLNGRGLTVRVGTKHRFSAAQVWLRQPEELIQFLAQWIQVCGR